MQKHETPELLAAMLSKLEIDSEAGIVRWKRVDGVHPKVAGKRAGSDYAKGYRRIRIDGIRIMEHRLIWAFVNGKWPDNEIDHINTIRAENRISNLREATHSQNTINQPKRSTNTSGFKGVSIDPYGRWRADIWLNGKQQYLGRYRTPTEASKSYRLAARKLHGEFARF